MGIRLRELEKDTRRITFCEAREHAETSTRNVNRGWKTVGRCKKVKPWKTEVEAKCDVPETCGIPGIPCWLARDATHDYGGAAAGMRHGLYRWGAVQARSIPPIQP
jgi:hypothetical protein